MNYKNITFICLCSVLLPACSSDSSTTPAATVTGSITTKMTLAGLPATLPINMSSTPNGSTEYYWRVIFDIDKNKATSTGDIYLILRHSKLTGSTATNAAMTTFNAEVYEYSSTSSSTKITDAVASVTGNTLTLSVAKSKHASLQNVNNTALAQFRASAYKSNGTLYGDSYPVENSVTTFMSIPADGKFTDDVLDLSVLLSLDVTFIDLQTMEIIID